MFLLEVDRAATGGNIFEGTKTAEEVKEAGENNGDMGQLSNDGIQLVVICAAYFQHII